MIDTIRCRPLGGHLLQINTERVFKSGGALRRPDIFRAGFGTGEDGHFLSTLVHQPTGLTLIGNEAGIRAVQVSLPRLLGQSNFELPYTQELIDQALLRLRPVLGELCTTVPLLEFIRIDLALNLMLPCSPVLSALKLCPHSAELRAEAEVFETKSGPHSIRFRGSQMNIACYDKIRQMVTAKKTDKVFKLDYKHRIGDVLRMEFQVKGEKLKRLLSNGSSYPTTIDLHRSYAEFRRLALMFHCVSPERLSERKEVYLASIAELERHGIPLSDGRPALEHLKEKVEKNTFRKHLRFIRSYLLRVQKLLLPDMLPEHWPPPRSQVVWNLRELDEFGFL